MRDCKWSAGSTGECTMRPILMNNSNHWIETEEPVLDQAHQTRSVAYEYICNVQGDHKEQTNS